MGAGALPRAGEKLEPPAQDDPDADRGKPTITECIQWEFFHSALGCLEVANSRSRSHPGLFRGDAGLGERGLGTQRWGAGGRPPGGALRPSAPGELPAPARRLSAGAGAGASDTPGHLPRPLGSNPGANLDAMVPARAPRPEPPTQCHPRPGDLHSGGASPPRCSAGLQSAAPHIAAQTQTPASHPPPRPVRPRGQVPTESEMASRCPSGRTPPPRGPRTPAARTRAPAGAQRGEPRALSA